MKQVYSNKTTIGLLIFCLSVLIGFLLFYTVIMISNIKAGDRNLVIVAAVTGCPFLMVAVLNVYVLNRAGCKIIYDSDTKVLYREGLFCGYKYQLKVEDIKEIIVLFLPKDETYYILVDPFQVVYESGYKKSFIRLKETKENLEFIQQFWDKPMKEYREYADYVRLVTNERVQK